MVPDALIRRPVAMILTEQKSLIEEMRRLTLKVVIPGEAARYIALQQVKAEHQRTAGLLQPLPIP